MKMFTSSTTTISGQPGPQTEFLRTPADICVYGGAAGGGKTVGLILEPLRHVSRVANFRAVFFRRTMPQITNPGALWDEAETSIRCSVVPRRSACASGAGHAAARSNLRTCSLKPLFTIGR